MSRDAFSYISASNLSIYLYIASVYRVRQNFRVPRWITEDIPNMIARANPFARWTISKVIRGSSDTPAKFRNRLSASYTRRDSDNRERSRERLRLQKDREGKRGEKYEPRESRALSEDGRRASLVFLSLYRDVNQTAIWHSSRRSAAVISSNAK